MFQSWFPFRSCRSLQWCYIFDSEEIIASMRSRRFKIWGAGAATGGAFSSIFDSAVRKAYSSSARESPWGVLPSSVKKGPKKGFRNCSCPNGGVKWTLLSEAPRTTWCRLRRTKFPDCLGELQGRIDCALLKTCCRQESVSCLASPSTGRNCYQIRWIFWIVGVTSPPKRTSKPTSVYW